MLAIRMQRTGRKGHAMFRVIVQDSRRTPTSGKVVAQLGSYDPHAKVITLNKEKAAFYLEHGAQPSDRVARLLQAEDVKLPDWVKLQADKERTVRNADKRRSTRPAEEVIADEAPAKAPESADEAAATAETSESETTAPSDTVEETASEEAPKAGDEKSTETETPVTEAAEEPVVESENTNNPEDQKTTDKKDEAAADPKAK